MNELSLVELVMISQGLGYLFSGYSKDISREREMNNHLAAQDTLDLLDTLIELMIKIDDEIERARNDARTSS